MSACCLWFFQCGDRLYALPSEYLNVASIKEKKQRQKIVMVRSTLNGLHPMNVPSCVN